MRQALLDSLAGKTVDEARRLVTAEGHEPDVMPHGVAATMIARPNTVMLWQGPDGRVAKASAGDPLELDSYTYER